MQIAVPFIILTGIGWLLVVIGFGILTLRDDGDRGDPTSYPQWIVSLCGPLIIGAALAHAASWMPATAIIGAVVSCVRTSDGHFNKNIKLQLSTQLML